MAVDTRKTPMEDKRIDDSGPAFPQALVETRDGAVLASYDAAYGAGLSLRDYFAAKALPAALAEFYRTGGEGEVWADHDDLADHVWRVADAMLKAREAK